MRFKQFLMEDNRVSFDGFLNSLNTMIERRVFLWRGMYFQDGKKLSRQFVEIGGEEDEISDSFEVNIYKFDARYTDRESVTGDSTILNIMSKWNGFPNRRRSYFATQSREHIEKFGADFALIIPADRPNIFGYMPYDVNEPDLGSKGFRTNKKLNDVSSFLRYAVERAREHYQDGNLSKVRELFIDVAEQTDTMPLLKANVMDGLNGESFDMAVRFCDGVARRMRKLDIKTGDIGFSVMKTFDGLYEKIESRGNALLADFFDDITPADFEASTHTLQNIPIDPEVSNEIWFEGPFIAINRYDLRDFNEDTLVTFLMKLRDTVQKDHERSKKIEV